MRKLLMTIYLIFAILFLVAEIVLNFRETKTSFSTIKFRENFVVEKLYYKFFGGTGNETSQGVKIVHGHFKNNQKERTLTMSEETEEKYRKYEGNDIYYEVWYNPQLNTIQLKTNKTGNIYYNGFLLMIFCAFIPFAIYSLTKIKKS